MSNNAKIDAFIDNYKRISQMLLTKVEDLQVALLLLGQADDLAGGLLRRGEGDEPQRVRVRLYLLDELERNEVEDESLLVENDDHHVLAKLDIVDNLVLVEGYLGAFFLLVIVPDDYFVALLLEDDDDYVGLVHHFDQADGLADLDFLLELGAT